MGPWSRQIAGNLAAMVYLIIAASVVSFAGLVALLSVARSAAYKVREARVAPEPFFFGMTYAQAFEDDYGLIWQTQVPALELIWSAGRRGLPMQSLKAWFHNAARLYPDLFEGHTFEEWVEFLHKSRVANSDNGERLHLTALGCNLLDYCRMAG
ncbi:MAG TPA: hypothetical protein VG892_05220 [Terriglobales bacterium]|nr:hypothetical protein [Terriglobales bacterium]